MKHSTLIALMAATLHAHLARRLFSAIRRNDPIEASLALSEGATPNWLEDGPPPPRRRLLWSSATQAQGEASPRDTAFLLALRLGSLKCAEILFPGADLSVVGASRQTPSNLAVRTKSMDWTRRVCSMADPSLADDDGRDALRVAVDLNFVEAASYLVTLSVDPNKARSCDNHKCQTPLCAAIVLGLPSMARFLAPITANLGTDSLDAPSPLALCATHDRLECAKILVENGALHKPDGAQGSSLPTLAAKAGHVHFLRWAISNSKPLSSVDLECLLLSAFAGGNPDCFGAILGMLPSVSSDLASLLREAARKSENHGISRDWLAAELERRILSDCSSPRHLAAAPSLRL